MSATIPLTPAQRRLRARLAALAKHAHQDPYESTAAARAVNAALPEAERKARQARLTYASSVARARRKADTARRKPPRRATATATPPDDRAPVQPAVMSSLVDRLLGDRSTPR